ncbi:MAG: aldehyde reductase [Roseiarcus sp.]|jgi:dihydroflavonol-4-reductase
MPDRVLLTGVSGFLGGHVASALLAAGYQVRGSVRNLTKANKARETLTKAGADVGRLEFVALDLLKDDGWDAAAQGCRFLLHTASPFVIAMPADKMELIRPATEGTERALNAGLKAGVERIVLTSSMAAIAYGHDRSRTAPFTAADWTDLAGRGCNAYIESKTRAERRAWEIMKAAGREADLTVINPSFILGPLLEEDPGTSGALVKRLLDGGTPAAPRLAFEVIDVRDVAAAHVTALTAPTASGRRFPMGERTLSLKDCADILRKRFPEYARKLPRFELPDWAVRLYALFDSEVRGNLGELGVVRRMDSRDVVALLGRDLIKADAALVATAESLIAFKLV